MTPRRAVKRRDPDQLDTERAGVERTIDLVTDVRRALELLDDGLRRAEAMETYAQQSGCLQGVVENAAERLKAALVKAGAR